MPSLLPGSSKSQSDKNKQAESNSIPISDKEIPNSSSQNGDRFVANEVSAAELEKIKKEFAFLVQQIKKYEQGFDNSNGLIAQNEGITGSEKKKHSENETSIQHVVEPEKTLDKLPNQRKPWSNFFKKNTLVEKGMLLSFVAPVIKAEVPLAPLDKNEVLKMSKTWENAVVMYVVGDTPSVMSLHKFIALYRSFVLFREVNILCIFVL